MTAPKLNPSLQEKNDNDFVAVTARIQAALAKIESAAGLKATQGVLSRLANCSRGTLNNRKWPLEQLQRIKEARRVSKTSALNDGSTVETEESRIARYKQQLFDSREEVLAWKTRHDEMAVQFVQLQEIYKVLQRRVTALADELNMLKRQGSPGKVVSLVPSPRKK